MNLKKIIGIRSRQLICGQEKRGAKLAFLKNMHLFVTEFNDKTKDNNGKLVTVKFILYNDNSFNYIIGNTPTSNLIKELVGEKKEITKKELSLLSEKIIPFINTENLEKAKKILIGTALSIGIKILD